MTKEQINQLRTRLDHLAYVNDNTCDDETTEPPMVTWSELRELAAALRDASAAITELVKLEAA